MQPDPAFEEAAKQSLPSSEGLESIDLEMALQPRRRQRWRSFVALALVGVLLLVVFHAHLPASLALFALNGSTGIASQQRIDFVTNVNYGTLLVNGHRQNVAVVNHLSAHLFLGTNTLTLMVPPFPTKKCVVTLPFDVTNGDSVNDFHADCSFAGTASINVPIFTRYFALTDLTADQQAQAQAQIQHESVLITERTATTVPVGQHYATGYAANGLPRVQIATQAISAQLIATPNFANIDCQPTCMSFDFGSSFPVLQGADWFLSLPVALAWDFTTPHGTLDVPLPASAAQAPNQGALFALAFGQGTWNLPAQATLDLLLGINPSPSSISAVLCVEGDTLLQNLADPLNQGSGGGYGTTQDIRACDVSVSTPNSNGSSTSFNYLFHFGALLALNTAAQHFLPQLPLATPDEAQLRRLLP